MLLARQGSRRRGRDRPLRGAQGHCGIATTMDRYQAPRRALSWPIARRSVAITRVIGSILNVTNQSDAVVGSGMVSWWKLVLTYCVPFCVATLGAYSAHRNAGPP